MYSTTYQAFIVKIKNTNPLTDDLQLISDCITNMIIDLQSDDSFWLGQSLTRSEIEMDIELFNPTHKILSTYVEEGELFGVIKTLKDNEDAKRLRKLLRSANDYLEFETVWSKNENDEIELTSIDYVKY